jgi:hypothetical protein
VSEPERWVAGLRRLEDAILAATENRWERLVFLAADLTPLFVKDGELGEVRIDGETVARWFGRIDIITHNHPLGTTFTEGDVSAAVALDARELYAFSRGVRYRLVRRAGGRGWPDWDALLAVIREIDESLRPGLLRRIARGEVSRAEAQALHRRLRWQEVSRRFAADVHYLEEQRS